MKNKPRLTPIEELRRHDRSMTPGSLDGRIAEARLILSSGSVAFVAEGDSGEGEDASILFWQDHFLITATGPQTFSLTHLPLDHSEHVYWDSIYQRDGFWTRQQGTTTVTIPDANNELGVGDVITIEYSYDPSAGEGE